MNRVTWSRFDARDFWQGLTWFAALAVVFLLLCAL